MSVVNNILGHLLWSNSPQFNKSGASLEQLDPGLLIQVKKLTAAVIAGEAISTCQTVVLDPDAHCVLSGAERNITNFNMEERVKHRMLSSNKTKI